MQIDSEFGHSRIRRVIAAFVPWDFSRVSATGTRWAFLMSVFAVAVIPSLTLAAGLGEPVATLIDPERRTNHFGWAISVSGNQVMVGSSVTTNIGGFTFTTEVGYADVFVREGGPWRHDGRMTSPNHGVRTLRCQRGREWGWDCGRFRLIQPERQRAKDPPPLKVKEVSVGDRRYVVCLNEDQRRTDAADREAIVAQLRE